MPLLGITYFSSKEYVDFNSRKSAYNRLLEAIKDDKNKMVGLYGMGGSGKTTLAKQVGKKVDELKLFEKVVWATVSKPPTISNIQQEIAEQIGLQLSETTELTRAQRLSQGLKNKRILIILDDVWSKLSLEQIGIPLNEGSCVLLTTRLLRVCVDMNCECTIELSILTGEEAWDLFNMHANPTNVSMNEFDSIGRKIVDECRGLPIAIVTVGSTLKRRSIQGWESTLQKLQHPLPLDVEDDLKLPYATLEVSYNSLQSSLAQSLFLLCSMFPEDHEIHIEDLIRFGKGILELGDNIHTMEDARKEISMTIDKLLDSCLLMHTDKQVCVKMHDVARDAALWIAKKKCQAILGDSNAVASMLVENETLKETKVISLWNLENDFKLPNQLCCPTLEILLLHPQGFIEDLGGIEELKVLAFVNSSFKWPTWFWERTKASARWQNIRYVSLRNVSSLRNVHTLCFRGIALGDISFLCQLKKLEILDLNGSYFDELPDGIVDMKKLKLLDVFGCLIGKRPLEVIGKCAGLEELYFWDYASAIPKKFSLPKLKRYVIYDYKCIIPYNPQYLPHKCLDSCEEPLGALCMQGFKVSHLNSSMKDLILRANWLWLYNCWWDHKDIGVKIKHLSFLNCPEKRFIVDNLGANILQTGQVFPHLINLILKQMDSLEQVFQDSSIKFSLPMLQDLYIESCPELTRIFPHATVISLPKLRKLEIYDCKRVKCLFSFLLASHCPSLVELKIERCFELERLIDEEVAHGDCVLHQRESHHDLHDYSHGNESERAFVVVTAESFKQLRNQKALTFFQTLKHVYIRNSGRRKKGIFEVKVRGTLEGEDSSEAQEEPLKLNLELCYLMLGDLAELEYIWKGATQSMSLHRLEYVDLVSCPKLKNIFNIAVVTSLPKLRILDVYGCQELEGIFCEESLKNLSCSSSNVCFPKLEKIQIWNCNKVKKLFSYSMTSHCPSLQQLDISDCSHLEGVVQAYEDEVSSHYKLLFPKLNYLRLIGLPKLREIYPGYEFNQLSGTMDIQDCPNIYNISLHCNASSESEINFSESEINSEG